MHLTGRIRVSLLCIAVQLIFSGCSTAPYESPKSVKTSLRGAIELPSAAVTRVDARNQFLLLMSESSLRGITGQHTSPSRSSNYRQFLNDLQSDFGVTAIADWSFASVALWCIVVRSENRMLPEALIDRLTEHASIDAVQPVSLFKLLTQPNNDPHRNLQSGLKDLRAEAAHRLTTGDGVRVALIDTGVEIDHPDIDSPLAASENFVDGDERAFSEDIHGTVIASIIGATRNNNEGIVGVAPDAELLALKACWATRPGYEGAICSSYTLAKALDYALRHQVDIINLSLAGPSDPLLERLLAQAVTDGTIVVGAAGVDATEIFPSNTDGVIAVSNQAGDTGITAPGENILAARPGNDYDFFSGRSIAVAHVSGLAALVRQRRPHISSVEMGAILKATEKLDACQIVATLIHAEC